MKKEFYTLEELKKKYAGKFLNVYPRHFESRSNDGQWITVYEVRGVSSTVKENYESVEDIG